LRAPVPPVIATHGLTKHIQNQKTPPRGWARTTASLPASLAGAALMMVMLKNGDILVFEPYYQQLVFSVLVLQNSENQNVPFFLSASVYSPLVASSATFALNAGE
jgi:hypothetical protein